MVCNLPLLSTTEILQHCLAGRTTTTFDYYPKLDILELSFWNQDSCIHMMSRFWVPLPSSLVSSNTTLNGHYLLTPKTNQVFRKNSEEQIFNDLSQQYESYLYCTFTKWHVCSAETGYANRIHRSICALIYVYQVTDDPPSHCIDNNDRWTSPRHTQGSIHVLSAWTSFRRNMNRYCTVAIVRFEKSHFLCVTK